MMQFACPAALLLLLLPFIVRTLLPAVKGLHGDALRVPFLNDLQKISSKSDKAGLGFAAGSGYKPAVWLLFLTYAFLVTAAARPQWVGEPFRLKNESRDILLVMDISNSMREPDFALNRKRIDRLTAVKATAQEFLEKRADDRIGLILFGTNAYLQAPLTFDKKSVSDILWQMSAGMAGESTAIGDALGLALKTIKDAPNPDKKIVILLTDGENNDGRLSLPQAIKLAQDEGVKIYTIGVGSDNAFMGSFMGIPLMGGGGQLDEASLKEIARLTEGRYFRAKDTAGLQKIYGEIDKLEPDDNEERYIREIRELFYIPLLAALATALILAFSGRRRYHV